MNTIEIFKNGERFNIKHLPEIGQQCFYMPGIYLVPSLFIPDYRTCIKSYIKPCAQCIVKRVPDKNNEEKPKLKHLVEVIFMNQNDTDIVSPDFLVSVELTEEGMEILKL